MAHRATPRLLTLAGVICLALGAAVPANAQPRLVVEHGQRPWVLGGWWRQAQGLPQDRVIALSQTRDGYLWVGTRGGVARFDGVTFTVWNAAAATRPPEGEVFSLVEPPDGGLLLGVYGGGLTRFRNGQFTTLTSDDGLVDNYVRCLTVARDGAIWIGTIRGLSRYHEGRFTNFHVKDGLVDESVRSLFANEDGVYVGTDHGLQRFAGGRFETVALAPGSQAVLVETIVRGREGRLWVGTSAGLFRLSAGGVTAFGPQDGLSSRAVRAVYEDSAGRIWAATNMGLDCATQLPGGPLRFAPVVAGADVTTVTEDQEHSIWVGYRGYGLARLQRSLFMVFDAEAGLPGNASSVVFQAQDGTIWAGVGTSLSAIRGSRIDTFAVESGLPDRAVSSLAQDSSGRLWVGTETGLFRSVSPVRCLPAACSARFEPVGGHPALRTHVRVLRPDGAATMLAGTNADGVIAVATIGPAKTSLLVPGEIRAIVRESADRLWVGTRGDGLVLRTPAGLVTSSTRDGLADNNVQTLFLDRDGTLWIGTRRGLSWRRDGRMVSVTAEQGLRENHVYGITDDAEGRLWLSSGSGVFTVQKRELFEYGAGTRTRIESVVYGLEHGLPSTLCALSHDPVITTAADGHVWVATLGGVVEADPAVTHAPVLRPSVHLESVVVDEALFPATAPIELVHGRGTLAFRFTAPSFVAPGDVRFRYRLEGFDPKWAEGGSSRDARFTNLPPGRYRFTVLARSGSGRWSDAGASIDIHLIPHFYQRAWFTVLVGILVVAAGVGAGVGVHRVRVRRLKASERELARRVEDAVAQIGVLQGLLPICAWCKRVRDDEGYWTQMEAYVRSHSRAEFSHGLCPDCLQANFPDDAESVSGLREKKEPGTGTAA